MPRPRRWVATAAAALVALSAVSLTGCSSAEDEPDAQGSSSATTDASSPGDASSSAAPAGVVVDITFDGDTVDPNGERIQAKVGEPVTLNVDADAAGELHVHSTPEQEIAYDAGTSEHQITIDRPGVVEVESHEPASIVLQLEVR